MADLVQAVIAWFHIFSAVGWLGGGIMFGFVIAPALARLTPPASGEFMIKVVPRVLRFFQVLPGMALLFGFLLLYHMTGGDFGMLSPSTSWGFDISSGILFALVTFAIAELHTVPTFSKAIGIVKQMQASGQPQPSPELPKVLNRARISATVGLFLLLVVLAFMVAAGFY